MTRISDLPAAESIEDDDILLLKKANGGDRRITVAELLGGVSVASGTGSVGVTERVGPVDFQGKNNAVTPNTQFDLVADRVTLSNSTGSTYTVVAPATVVNNLLTAGPAANGRDQAGAFTASSWVHFYWIWNGSTIASLSSASATSPSLPAGYTHWAYACAVRFDGASALIKTRILGSNSYYEAQQSVLVSGAATVETFVSIATFVPPNASRFILSIAHRVSNAASNGTTAVGYISGAIFVRARSYAGGAGQDVTLGETVVTMPNVGQQFHYDNEGGSNATTSAWVQGYSVPNGDY